MIGILDKQLTIQSFVLQTSAIQNTPHEQKIILKMKENASLILSTYCSCKSGQTVCKHITAVLLHINKKAGWV